MIKYLIDLHYMTEGLTTLIPLILLVMGAILLGVAFLIERFLEKMERRDK